MTQLAPIAEADLVEFPPAALDGARRVRALVDASRQIAQVMEARILEEVWSLRALLPDRAWAPFVAAHLPFDVARADAMVATWSAARTRRELRELAQSSPSEAVDLVSQSIAAGVPVDDATDEQVVRILASPPRLRRQAMRQLVAAAAPAADEPAAETPEPADRTMAPLLRGARQLAALAAELRMDAEVLLSSPLSDRTRQDLRLWLDNAAASVDRISEMAESTVPAREAGQ